MQLSKYKSDQFCKNDLVPNFYFKKVKIEQKMPRKTYKMFSNFYRYFLNINNILQKNDIEAGM